MAMVQLSWFCILHCLLLTFIPCQTLIGDNICTSIDGFRIMKGCCKDYFQMKNMCVQCARGSFGINCSSSCPKDYYGLFCQEKCNCSSEKYCDSIKGCLCRNNSVNCTDRNDDQEVSSAAVTRFVQSTAANSRKTKRLEILLPPLLAVIACVGVLAVGGRIWYANSTLGRKEPAIRDQESVQNDSTSREIYSHINLRVRLSNTSFSHTRREQDAERDSSVYPEPSFLSHFQLNNHMFHNTGTDCQEGSVRMDHNKKVHKKTGTTIITPPSCENGTNEPFYKNSVQNLQQAFSNTEIPPHTTRSNSDVSYFNVGHVFCSSVDIRPDSTVSSQASDDTYFDVSYAGQLVNSVDDYNASNHHTLSIQKQDRRQCQTDGTERFKSTIERTKSGTEMSSFLKRTSTGSLCLKKEKRPCSPDTRPDSPIDSETSDELYFDVSYLGQTTDSSIQHGVSDSLSTSGSSENGRSDYINCGDLA